MGLRWALTGQLMDGGRGRGRGGGKSQTYDTKMKFGSAIPYLKKF